MTDIAQIVAAYTIAVLWNPTELIAINLMHDNR